jgi:hypothetical protein
MVGPEATVITATAHTADEHLREQGQHSLNGLRQQGNLFSKYP